MELVKVDVYIYFQRPPPRWGGWGQLAKLARHSVISLFGSGAADLHLPSTFTTGRPRAPTLEF